MIRRARLKIAEPRLSGAPLCEQHQGQIWGHRLWKFLGEFASSLLNLEQTPVWFSKLWSFLKFFATLLAGSVRDVFGRRVLSGGMRFLHAFLGSQPSFR